MQSKKKNSGRIAAREVASPKVSRTQRKQSGNSQVAEKKVSELIASSARKQRVAVQPPKENLQHDSPASLLTKYNVLRDETSGAHLEHEANIDDCLGFKDYNDEPAHSASDTIFSPGFHMSKHVGVELTDEVDFFKIFRNGDQHGHGGEEACESVNREENYYSNDSLASLSMTFSDLEGASLSSEVSAIYLAMKNSKLECVDEHGQEPTVADAYTQDDGYEEFDDFDPYFFIKNLPDLSAVVPTYRPMLLPKQTRSCPSTTLVLDLDETLVHSTLEPCDDADFTFPVNFNLQEHIVYVRCRPYLKDFMERVSGLFEIIIFTASQSIYAEQLLNVLDPKRKVFRHRVFRESCVFVDGNYLKDLSVLGRDLARVVIVDNSPQAFGFQVDNGIPIESWFDDRSDKELLLLLPFLESLVGVEDVRPLIAQKFNLREKIAAAGYSLDTIRADPF